MGASLGLRSVIRLRSCVGETADIVEESPDDVDFFLPLPFVLGLDAEPSALLVVRFALVTGWPFDAGTSVWAFGESCITKTAPDDGCAARVSLVGIFEPSRETKYPKVFHSSRFF